MARVVRFIKLISILSISYLLYGPSASFAQSDFEGFYGQVSTGYEKDSFNSNNQTFWYSEVGGGTGTGHAPNQQSTVAPLVLGVGYNKALSDSFLLGLGIDYSALSQSVGNFSQTITVNNSDGSATLDLKDMSYKVSNRVNLFVSPSYAFTSTSLAYLKAGYSIEKLQFSQGSNEETLPSGFSSGTTINGYIVGLGYKQMIYEGIYAFTEGNYMSYNSKSVTGTGVGGLQEKVHMTSTPTITTYNFLVGIGYKF